MASPKSFLVSIDLNKNELLNAAIQNLATAPSNPVEGQIYFNTTDKKPYLYANAAWICIGGDIESLANATNGGLIVTNGTGPNVTLKIDVDDSSLELSGTGKLQIKASGILNSMILTNTIALNKLVQIANLRLLGNVSGATANVVEVTVETALTDDDTKIPTSGAVVDAIAAALVSAVKNKGGYNAATNTPDLDTAPSGVKNGDMYTVTADGTFFTVALKVGDVLISNQDNPTLVTHWTIVERNLDQATETIPGYAEIATQAEVTTGTDNEKIVTPLKLKEEEERFYNAKKITSRLFFTITGNAISNSWDFGHDFDDDYVVVEVCDAISKDTVITGVTRLEGRVNISFNVPPASGKQYLVVIVGNYDTIS